MERDQFPCFGRVVNLLRLKIEFRRDGEKMNVKQANSKLRQMGADV